MERLGFAECLVSEADILDGLVASQVVRQLDGDRPPSAHRLEPTGDEHPLDEPVGGPVLLLGVGAGPGRSGPAVDGIEQGLHAPH